tara:strand:- start:93 stop:536 length:444 start_codon:yes stop_codon:yes gene_type:complete
MDDVVKKIKTPDKCLIFAKNAKEKGRDDLALQAKERAIQLKAEVYGADTQAEREAIEAVYAYEEVLTLKNNKKTRASRTWPMIKRHGILNAVERAVNREAETQGYNYLLEMGLQNYAFEAVILRHPELFSDESVTISKRRISEWEKT